MFELRKLQCVGLAALFAAVAACGGNDNGGDTTPLKFPEQQRKASLNFASASDAYLMTVWGSPGIGEAASASDIIYDLTPGTATTGLTSSALTLTRFANTDARVPTLGNDYWNARLAVEKSRRDGIDTLATELEARGESLVQANPQALHDACSCTTAQTCTPGTTACVGSLNLSFGGGQRAYTVIDNVTVGGIKITIVTDNPGAANAQLSAIAEDFGSAAAIVLQVMGQDGHNGVLDVDGSGSVTVAFTDNFGTLPASTVGVFVFGDYLDTGKSGATGNHSDILWARFPSVANTHYFLIGTLAHEYQHLVSFALRSELGDPTQLRETLWLDEGVSHLMEDLTGWGGSTIDAYSEALQNWDNTPFAGPNDTVAQRGRAYMLLRYLVDQKARAAGATNAKSAQVNQAAHDVLAPLYTQSRRGFQHQLFQDARNGGQLVDWLRANYTTGNTDVTGASASAQFLPTATSPAANGQLIGFNPFGTYTTARAESVPLAGPKTDDSLDTGFTDAVNDSIVDSGARYYLVTGGTGNVTVNLTADKGTDINIDAVKVK